MIDEGTAGQVGKAHLDFLRRFLPYENGIPGHDRPGLIFGALDAATFRKCFISWKQALSGALARWCRGGRQDPAAFLLLIEAFGPGTFIQTGIRHIGMLIQYTGAGSLDIPAPGTWADSAMNILYENALPRGGELKP